MDTMKTILCCTDHTVPTEIWETVKRNLSSMGLPIVCVSHEPVDLGHNIAIGKHKRSWLTLYKQLLTGLKEIKTKYVSIAEHDCLYTKEHFEFIPPRDDTFYYNENVLFLQYKGTHPELDGVFSKPWNQRLALSQLVCSTELYREVLQKRVDILTEDKSLIKEIEHIGEPGYSSLRKAQRYADSGKPVYLKEYLGEALELERYETFNNKIPNLDIRHGGNFTGPRRGRKREFKVPYWGTINDILCP